MSDLRIGVYSCVVAAAGYLGCSTKYLTDSNCFSGDQHGRRRQLVSGRVRGQRGTNT